MNPYQQIRQQSLMGGYDQLTNGGGGGMMGYSDEPNPSSPYTPGPGLEQVAAQQDPNAILGPDGQPLESNIQAPTIAAPSLQRQSADDSVRRTMDLINQVYTPETRSRDRNDRLLDNFPTREAPSLARSLFAGALSLKAQDPLAMAERVNYAPYARDLADFNAKAEPFYKSAQLENTANSIERQLATGVVQSQTAADRLTENARQADQKAEIAKESNEIRWAVARGWKNITGPNDPTYTLQSPDGTIRKTTVPTGSLIELEDIRERGRLAVEAAGARVNATAANQQGEMVTYIDPKTGKSSPGQRVGNTVYPLEMAQPGQRPGQSQGSGVGTTVPITPPGSTPGQPVASRTPGKPITGPVYKVGTEQEEKALSPQQQRVETSNKIDGIISRHPNWRNYVNYNPDTKLYEGMGDPPPVPRTAGLFGIGGGGASDEDWTKYKDNMDGYNQIRSLLHPEMPPLPVVGGSNAEQRAQRQKEAAKATPPGTSSKFTSPAGIGPSGSVNATPSGSGTAGIGPSTTPNDPKSLPGGGGSTTSSDKNGTWMPPTGKYAFLPDYMNKPSPPNSSKVAPAAPPKPPPTPLPTNEVDNGPDAIPADLLPKFQATIPRGSKVDAQGNTFRYQDPKGNVRYWSRELDRWVDYDPTSGPRRR